MKTNTEQWRPVIGFEGFYEVSDLGRVRSLVGRWGEGRILNPHTEKRGYQVLDLRKPGCKRPTTVGVLVAEAFIGPRPERHEVCHNNGNPTDNRLENLRYDTSKGNCSDRKIHGTYLCGEQYYNAKLSDKKVIYILADPRTLREIAEDFGVSGALISSIKKGKTWKHIYAKYGATKSRGQGKLSPEHISAIRANTVLTNRQLGLIFGVKANHIHRIKAGKRYR